ncbi:hypothetical protein ACOMHN_008663 [Nucella lapillus]
MLRGPVQTSFPSLDALPREAGTSGHVYPFSAPSASPSMSQTDALRLPSSLASATFWRSPYSEALRQSKSPGSGKRADGNPSSRDSYRSDLDAILRSEGGVRGKDSGFDLTGETVLQLRGILCKSSLSSSSRQSVPKVQKRVMFEDSVGKGQTCRQSQSASCGRTSPPKQDLLVHPHRSLSASLTVKPTLRMPSLRPPADLIDKNGPPQSPSPSPSLLPNPHQYPHIPKTNAGLIRTSSLSDLTLPRPCPKPGSQNSYQLVHGPHSCVPSTGPGSTSSTGQDFKVYRQSQGGTARVAEGMTIQSPALHSNKGRFFANPAHSTRSRTFVRLSRSFTSPSITLPRPVKRPVPSSSSNDDLPLTPPASGVGGGGGGGPHPEGSAEKAITARDVVQAIQADAKNVAEKRANFLDDDKTVQILHWLQEVGHRQAREGRCPVFASTTSREV